RLHRAGADRGPRRRRTRRRVLARVRPVPLVDGTRPVRTPRRGGGALGARSGLTSRGDRVTSGPAGAGRRRRAKRDGEGTRRSIRLVRRARGRSEVGARGAGRDPAGGSPEASFAGRPTRSAPGDPRHGARPARGRGWGSGLRVAGGRRWRRDNDLAGRIGRTFARALRL